METTLNTPSGFTMTPAAAARINMLKQQEGNTRLRFRISIKGGGCSGFQYEFSLDDGPLAQDDRLAALGDAEAVIDDVSLSLAQGSVLDYVEDLSSAGFEIKNPNATARCGCGNSFSINLG